MTGWHWLQVALAGFALLWFGARFYHLAIVSALDAELFLERLASVWRADPLRGRGVCTLEPRGAVSQLAAAVLEASSEQRDGELVELELRREAVAGIGGLRTLGRVASPLAFAGVMFDLAAALGGGRGLEALQRGLAEQLALDRAILAMCIGVSTSLFCFAAATRLQHLARDRFADLRLTIDVAESLVRTDSASDAAQRPRVRKRRLP